MKDELLSKGSAAITLITAIELNNLITTIIAIISGLISIIYTIYKMYKKIKNKDYETALQETLEELNELKVKYEVNEYED